METRRNLRDWIRVAAAGEPILGVVLEDAAGRVVSWSEAAERLNHEVTIECGHSADALFAWTRLRVIFVNTYDGRAELHWVPRAPSALVPELGGFEVD